MSTTVYTVFLIITAVIINPFRDMWASKIYSLDVPPIVRNGTGPIDLSCMYKVKEEENGLVIKWYHNTHQIYQWIPPLPPEDIGVINGFVEYPKENLRQANERSTIQLRMVTVEMTGLYTCAISTFQEEDSKSSKMIVYVPETNASIHVSSFNESHLNITCATNGAQPKPVLKFYAEGVEVDPYYSRTEKLEGYENNLMLRRSAIVSNSLEPMLLECEISIPHTDYKRRERIVYYPTQVLSQRSNASSYLIAAVNIIFVTAMLLL